MEKTPRRWYVFGAQAVIVYGQPRLTADVDVTAEVFPQDMHAFIHDMTVAVFSLRVITNVDDFITRTRVLPFVHASTQMPLDVVLLGPGLEEQFHARARRIDVGGNERFR